MRSFVIIISGAIAGVALSVFVSVLFFCCRRRRRSPPQRQLVSAAARQSPGEDSFQSAIDKFHNRSKGGKNSLRFHQLHHSHNHDHSILQPFNWDAHPRLISEVVDHGWSQFVFADRSSVPRSSPLWSLCASCDAGAAAQQQQSPRISWEVQPDTSEFMQTVRINPKSRVGSSNTSPLFGSDHNSSCTRMSLPLPGPPSIGMSFPQEAYFEITIAQLHQPDRVSDTQKPKQSDGGDDDDDRLKLIHQNPCRVHSDGRVEMNSPSTESQPNNSVICLGLTTGGSDTKLVPGTYPGSIGLRSDGSVFLDGMKLVSESIKAEWATIGKAIGCGFSPSKKKVFFTVDSELVHVIRCNAEAYRSPLYPILAANSDTTIVVNLGQAAFRYAPANARRTPNPCFIHSSPSLSCHSVGAYDDSREFYSVAVPDSECRDRAENSQSPKIISNSKSSKRSRSNWDEDSVIMDIDKDSDLFEIALNI